MVVVGVVSIGVGSACVVGGGTAAFSVSVVVAADAAVGSVVGVALSVIATG